MKKDTIISKNFQTTSLSNYPLISVILLAHYRPLFLIKAVDSILNQTYKNIEFIIIDNAAIEEVQKYLDKLKKIESKIKIIKYEKNQWSYEDPVMYIRTCYNDALKIAKGELIFCISDDDYVAEDFFERIVNLFINNSKCTTAIGRVIDIDHKGNETSIFPIKNRSKYVNGYELSLDSITSNKINQYNPGFSFVMKKDQLIKHGGFHSCLEYHQMVGIVPFGVNGFDKEALMYWRRHPMQLNLLNYGRCYYNQHYLDLLLNPKLQIIKKWINEFGTENALKLKKHFYFEINKQIYRAFFCNVFKFKIHKAIILYFNKRKIIKNKIKFSINGFTAGLNEAFARSKFGYFFRVFFQLIISPIKTSKKIYNKL